jgi:hypothetical protein
MSNLQPFYILHEQETPISNSCYPSEQDGEIWKIISSKFYTIMKNHNDKWLLDSNNLLKINPFEYDKLKIKFQTSCLTVDYNYKFKQDFIKDCKFLLVYIKKNPKFKDNYHHENNPNEIFNNNTYKIVLFTDTSYILFCKPILIESVYYEEIKNVIKIDQNYKFQNEENQELSNEEKIIFTDKFKTFLPSKKKYLYIVLDDSLQSRIKAKSYILYIKKLLNCIRFLDDKFPKELCDIIQTYFCSYRLSFLKEYLRYNINTENYELYYTRDYHNFDYDILSLSKPTIKDIITLENINELIRDELSGTHNEGISYINSETFKTFTWCVSKWVLELKIEK